MHQINHRGRRIRLRERRDDCGERPESEACAADFGWQYDSERPCRTKSSDRLRGKTSFLVVLCRGRRENSIGDVPGI